MLRKGNWEEEQALLRGQIPFEGLQGKKSMISDTQDREVHRQATCAEGYCNVELAKASVLRRG